MRGACVPTRSGSDLPDNEATLRRLLLTIAVLVLPVSFAAGCGDTGGAASGASELVPAGAVMYG